MSWAAAVRQLRKARGWTQAAVVKASGDTINIGTLGNIERGRHENPTDGMQRRLAQAFGISVEELRRAAGMGSPAASSEGRLEGIPDDAMAALTYESTRLRPEDWIMLVDLARYAARKNDLSALASPAPDAPLDGKQDRREQE